MTCKKSKFATEADAQFFIDKLKRTSTRIDIPKRSYLCPHCLCYHLTHRDLFTVEPIPVPPGHQEQIETLTAALQKRKKRMELLRAEIVRLRMQLNEAHNMINHLKGIKP